MKALDSKDYIMWKALLVLAMALPCLARAELVPDAGFGTAGSVDMPLAGMTFNTAPRTSVLADRRVVVTQVRATRYLLDWLKMPALSLTRLLPDGSADPTFGSGAPVMLEVSPSGFHYARLDDVGVRPDGSLFALVSFATMSNYKQTVLVSVTADGRLDPAFNGGAPLVVAPRGYEYPKVFDTGSGYLVVGIGRFGTAGVQLGFDAWRLHADGTPDVTFGVGGSIVVAGSETGIGSTDVMPVPGSGFQVLNFEQGEPVPNYWRRYRADGTVDTAFGTDGVEAIPNVGGLDDIIRTTYPLGDGTYAAVAGGSCVQRVLDAQGRTLTTFDGLCIGGATTNPNVQAYGAKMLVSAEQRFGGVPPPSDGTYLWVLDRDGTVDRAFAGSQGDRWRPTTNPNASYAVAADGDRGVVLTSVGESSMRVQRYVDVRGGVTPNQPIPALGVPALLLILGGTAALARRRLEAHR